MTSTIVNASPYQAILFCEKCRDEYHIMLPKNYNHVVNLILKFAEQHKPCHESTDNGITK